MATTVPIDMSLRTPDGESVRLADHLTEPRTVVQLVRYFGCLPCQEWAVEFDARRGEFAERGTGTLIIGGSADYQARWLAEEKGVTSPMLLDPHNQFREAVGAQKRLVGKLLHPLGAASYLHAVRAGYQLQKPTKDALASPGVVILEKDGTMVWRHVGARLGDYPSVDELLTVVSRNGVTD